MKNLQEKVQAMLDGEAKRRSVAIKFIEEVTEILVPVAHDIWGSGNSTAGFENTAWLSTKDKDKRKYTDIYFRYEEFSGDRRYELNGFFSDTECKGVPIWGKKLVYLKGRDFWDAVRIIIEWVEYVGELMEYRSISREELLSKISQ